jgi:hypothetical protein
MGRVALLRDSRLETDELIRDCAEEIEIRQFVLLYCILNSSPTLQVLQISSRSICISLIVDTLVKEKQ